MKKIVATIFICSLLLTASCANKTSIRHRNDYAKILKKCSGIAVLPAKAEVNMVSIGGDKKRMYDYEYEIENIIFRAAKPILRKKGYRVSLLNKSSIKDKNVFSSYESLYEDLAQENDKLYAEPLMDVEKAHNIENKIGKHSVVIGKETQGDVLFLVNYVNNIQTNGARAVGFMMDMLIKTHNTSEVDKSAVLVSMIDAKTGNVVWSNFFSVASSLFGDMFKGDEKHLDNKKIDALLSGALQGLPNKAELLDQIESAS